MTKFDSQALIPIKRVVVAKLKGDTDSAVGKARESRFEYQNQVYILTNSGGKLESVRWLGVGLWLAYCARCFVSVSVSRVCWQWCVWFGYCVARIELNFPALFPPLRPSLSVPLSSLAIIRHPSHLALLPSFPSLILNTRAHSHSPRPRGLIRSARRCRRTRLRVAWSTRTVCDTPSASTAQTPS